MEYAGLLLQSLLASEKEGKLFFNFGHVNVQSFLNCPQPSIWEPTVNSIVKYSQGLFSHRAGRDRMLISHSGFDYKTSDWYEERLLSLWLSSIASTLVVKPQRQTSRSLASIASLIQANNLDKSLSLTAFVWNVIHWYSIVWWVSVLYTAHTRCVFYPEQAVSKSLN